MNFRYILAIISLHFLAVQWGPLVAQEVQNVPDSLIQMPAKQFGKWLMSELYTTGRQKAEFVASAVRMRMQNQQGIPANVMMRFLQESRMTYSDKIYIIDKILPFSLEDKKLQIDLLNLQSVYLSNDSIPNDSVLLLRRLELQVNLEEEYLHIMKIRYSNFIGIGDIYLNVYRDTAKAIDYFIKARGVPFFQFQNSTDIQYFLNLYVQGCIGQIKCLQGSYARLKELSFYPAAYPDILPTYKVFMEDAGGKCDLCDTYFKNNAPKNLKPPPPPEHKNE